MTTAGGEPPIAPLWGVASAGSWRSWCCRLAWHPFAQATGRPTPGNPPSPHHCLSLLAGPRPRGNPVPVDSLFFYALYPTARARFRQPIFARNIEKNHNL